MDATIPTTYQLFRKLQQALLTIEGLHEAVYQQIRDARIINIDIMYYSKIVTIKLTTSTGKSEISLDKSGFSNYFQFCKQVEDTLYGIVKGDRLFNLLTIQAFPDTYKASLEQGGSRSYYETNATLGECWSNFVSNICRIAF